MGEQPASGGYSALHHERVRLAAEHNPETCKTTGNVVVRAEDGNMYCGPGGYWPTLGVGQVTMKGGLLVRGEFIRAN